MSAVLEVRGLAKTFTLHTQGGVRIPVYRSLSFEVCPGECLALTGPSGSGKSTVLRSLYGNYKASAGSIAVRHGDEWIDVAAADPHTILAVRRLTMGYVSQFLRVIPRVTVLELVSRPLLEAGVEAGAAQARAGALLARLNLPEALWHLPPATFSGGEQQRVNIARSLVRDYPLLLLDEPTASLDADNRRVVVELIMEAARRGTAMVGIFHDDEVREAVATRVLDVSRFAAAA